MPEKQEKRGAENSHITNIVANFARYINRRADEEIIAADQARRKAKRQQMEESGEAAKIRAARPGRDIAITHDDSARFPENRRPPQPQRRVNLWRD